MTVDEFLLLAEIFRKIHAVRLFGWLKRFGDGFIAAPDQHLDTRLGFLELLAALLAQLHAAFEQLERSFQGKVALFQFAHGFFELFERFFKSQDGLFGVSHSLHFTLRGSLPRI